jgi:hypothetical protein
MNFQFLLDATNGQIFKIMADVTDKLLSKRMDIIVQQGKHHPHPLLVDMTVAKIEKVSSIFFSRAAELAESSNKDSVDLFEYCQNTVSDAMVVLLLGRVGRPNATKFEQMN